MNNMDKENRKQVLPISSFDKRLEPLCLNRFLLRTPPQANIYELLVSKVKIKDNTLRITVRCMVGRMNTRTEFIAYGKDFNNLDKTQRAIVIEDLDFVGDVIVKTVYKDCIFKRVDNELEYDYGNEEVKSYDIIFTYEEVEEIKM